MRRRLSGWSWILIPLAMETSKDELLRKIQTKIDQGAETVGDVDVNTLKEVIKRKEKEVVK